MKTVISTAGAPAAIGPYSQGILAGDTLFVSGQIPIDPATGEMAEGIQAQAHQSLKNVKAIVEAAGMTMDNIVKTTVLIKDMAQFPEVNEVYAQYFEGEPPARACFAVVELPKGAGIEIEAIAVK